TDAKTKRTHRRRQTASSKPRVTLILEKDTEQKFHNANAESSFWIRARKTDNRTARAREVRPNFPGTSMKRSENKRAHHRLYQFAETTPGWLWKTPARCFLNLPPLFPDKK